MNSNRQHVLVAVLVLAACGGNGGPPDHDLSGESLNGNGVVLTTEHSSYGQGVAVELTIQNQESQALAYNPCTRRLEILEKGTWVPGPERLRLCTKDVNYVQAGATRRDSTDLDIGLTPGEYRFVITFARDYAPDDEVIRGVSNSFTITP